ncbi:erythromycin esterase family protein [Catellatospora coxensis]|uniref:Erythromycin esterase n=1 Tax=Catellatospora coxensis TaxID=310354 RepID=A0A8J3P6X7_9ACTN|nr:erythromycin esterase family protein [Catellatospora coxensis]GIG05973.1 erythromycin esterase [Catellatospora coxensis]
MTVHSALPDAGWAFTDDAGPAVTRLLDTLPVRPRLLGLGEPIHGEELFLRVRNRLLRHLVEHEGYRSIALESDCLAGLVVDEYVAGGPGSLDDVMARGISHGWGAFAGNRELVAWMREYNQGRPDGDRLRFYGFDAPTEMMYAQSPRHSLTEVRDHLTAWGDAGQLPDDAALIDDLAGADDRWTDEAAAMDPSRSVGSSPEAVRLRLLADDLRALLMAQAPRLLATAPEADRWRARLHARAASGLLRYHAVMAAASPSRYARLMVTRDTMMAENLLGIAAREADRGPTLVFAHNAHLQREEGHWRSDYLDQALIWWTAGAIAAAELGDRYAFVATAVGAIHHRGLGAPAADTLEGVLSTLPDDPYLLAGRRLATALRTADLAPVRRSDNTDDHGFFPRDPAHIADSDGILFLRDVPTDKP